MIIGVAGTAKNTGKTTALCALIRMACANGRLPGVTGIGYDGEERDNITLLPKPRITVLPGMLVSTSEACLAASTARLRVLKQTGVVTALGRVVVAEVEAGGLVVVAGPNKTSDLSLVTREMQNLGSTDILVDGSLNRIAPMSVVQRVVFATGGARSVHPAVLADETAAIELIFKSGEGAGDYTDIGGIRLVGRDIQVQCRASAFHGYDEIAEAMGRIPEGLKEIVLPGMVTADGLALLRDRLQAMNPEGVSVIFDNPFRILLSGEPAVVGRLLGEFSRMSVNVRYRRATTLAAITFNPYYPAFDGTSYRAAYLESAVVRAALAGVHSTPVIDVLADGAEALFSRCFAEG